MMSPDIWFVAFGPDKTLKSDEILAKGWSATAGTLNPHQPKRVIGASQIEDWAAPHLR